MRTTIQKSLFMLLIVFGVHHTGYAMDGNNNNTGEAVEKRGKRQRRDGEYLGFNLDNGHDKSLKETLLWMLQTHEGPNWNPPLPAEPQQRNMPNVNVPQLLVAAKVGNVEFAHLLFLNDVNTAVEFAGGVNALHVAAEHGQTDMVKFLHKNGFNLEHKDDKGLTPLLRASFYGHVAVVSYLLKKGVRRDATTHRNNSDKGYSALDLALGNSQKEMVAFLCDRGVTKTKFRVYFTSDTE